MDTSVTPSIYSVHTSVSAFSWSFFILQVGSGFSSNSGEFAFIFLNFEFLLRFSFVSRFIQF